LPRVSEPLTARLLKSLVSPTRVSEIILNFGNMKDFYYVYVLTSEKDHKNYTGYTQNLKLRLEQHQKGEVESTKYRRPLKLIYFEACLNQNDT
jgi:hypothetical protein